MTVARRHGWTTLQNVGCVETGDLVARIRRFRGRKRICEIVTGLGMPPSRVNWLRVRDLCLRYEIATADPDDPEYFRGAIAADRRAEEAAFRQGRRDADVALARNALRAEIARAVAEQPTAPRYKPGPLEWRA